MRRSTFAVFDQLHQQKNAELGTPLSRGQMLDIVVSSAAAVLATKVEEKPPATSRLINAHAVRAPQRLRQGTAG